MAPDLVLALARWGELAEGERPAREALYLLEPTEWLDRRADAHLALGEITGDLDHVRRALDLYQKKGNVVMAERAHDRLAAAIPAGTTDDNRRR